MILLTCHATIAVMAPNPAGQGKIPLIKMSEINLSFLVAARCGLEYYG
jgi:hypothetical protein